MEPSYRRTLKEAIVAALLWLGAGVWVIAVSYWLGSGRPVWSIGGVPNWVLWGVLVPWLTLFLLHTWYSLVFLRADDDAQDRRPPEARKPGSGR